MMHVKYAYEDVTKHIKLNNSGYSSNSNSSNRNLMLAKYTTHLTHTI